MTAGTTEVAVSAVEDAFGVTEVSVVKDVVDGNSPSAHELLHEILGLPPSQQEGGAYTLVAYRNELNKQDRLLRQGT